MNTKRMTRLMAAIAVLACLVVPLQLTPAAAGGSRLRLTVARSLPGLTVADASPGKLVAPKAAGCSTAVPRERKDRPDLREGPLVHVIYLVPSDFLDEKLDVKGILDCSIQTQNAWFEDASDGLRWRFDSFTANVKDQRTGRMARREVADVTFVRSARPGSELDGAFDVAAELESLGFAEPDKRYLSFVAAESAGCGDAIFPIASPLTGPIPDGQYAQVYLFADEGCRSREFGSPGKGSFAEMIAQQEIIHNDAIVTGGAPHGCGAGVPPGMGHVCTGPLVLTEGQQNLDPERFDVMYPYVSVPLSEKVLDQGNDDYFRHLLPNLSDLEDSPFVEPAK